MRNDILDVQIFFLLEYFKIEIGRERKERQEKREKKIRKKLQRQSQSTIDCWLCQ